jgi:hypothetical protein
VPVLGCPSHLHQRRNRDRDIGRRETAANKHGGLKGPRTKDANTTVAQIVNAAVKFLGQDTSRLTRQQTSPMNFQHLWKAFMPTAFSI